MRIQHFAILGALAIMLLGAANAKADTDDWDIRDGEWYAEIGAGYSTSLFQSNADLRWKSGGSPGAYFSLRYEWMPIQGRLGIVLHATHHSNWLTGPPFDNDAESSLDHIGGAIRWRLGR